MKQFEIHPEQELNRAYCESFLDHPADSDPNEPLGMKVGNAISFYMARASVPRAVLRSSLTSIRPYKSSESITLRCGHIKGDTSRK
jgi:hypothetical protein